MEWLPWNAEAFARAARERKPVLLSISATWCRACHEMDRTTYADADVQAVVAERFVAIRVDTDQRPDINDRYNLGGWPTTAFLTASGELIGGGTYLDAQRMVGVLRQVAEAYASLPEQPGDLPFRDRQPAAKCESPGSVEPPDADQVFASFDDQCGGFGIEPKFPLTSPLLLAMALYRDSADVRYRSIVERTLDAIAEGGLHDAESGGYYRYTVTRDWKLPHRERLLETNARLLAAFTESAATFGRAIDRERSIQLASFVAGLQSPSGGYRSSTDDTSVYAASTAFAVAALLGSAELAGDDRLARTTLAQFERFLLSVYRPGRGVAHSADADGQMPGLLIDQIATGGALLAAYALTGDPPYRMMAEELGLYSLRMFGAPGGGFFDRATHPSDVGLLRERRIAYADNCEAAAFFGRLRQASTEPALADAAEQALRRVADAAREHGPDAARWLMAAKMQRSKDQRI